MRLSFRLTLLIAIICLMLLPSCSSSSSSSSKSTSGVLIPVRFAAIGTASQAFIPTILIETGIGKKYGFDVQLQTLSASSQQWIYMRAGNTDVVTGSFMDLLRQRKAGLGVQAFDGFYTFGNPIIAPVNKHYQSLQDLKGARVGTPGTTILDWMILRAAGVKMDGFDIEKETKVSQASQPLLNQMLLNNQLDAALQFTNVAFAPVHEGKLKVVTNVRDVMASAGLDTKSFYLLYNVRNGWRAKYGNTAVAKLAAAIRDAVNVLETDNAVWPQLAKNSGVTNTSLVPAFMNEQRPLFKVDYDSSELQPTQMLLNELVSNVGEAALGVTTVDPNAFDFASVKAAKNYSIGK